MVIVKTQVNDVSCILHKVCHRNVYIVTIPVYNPIRYFLPRSMDLLNITVIMILPTSHKKKLKSGVISKQSFQLRKSLRLYKK